MQKIFTMLCLLISSNAFADAGQKTMDLRQTLAATDLIKLSFSLLVVLVAIAFFLAIVKKLNRFSINESKSIKRISSMSVGIKEKIMIIEVANEQLVLGVTPQSITHLHTLKEKVRAESQGALNLSSLMKKEKKNEK
jgi:flagellar protein FliO/FliZ